MVPYRSRRRKLVSDINVVPYIDVMLVLLVIFMITAPLLNNRIAVDLPQATGAALAPDERKPLVVTVDRRGRYYLDDRMLNAPALRQEARNRLRGSPRMPVYVRADRQALYEYVIGAMSALREAGAQSVGLITEEPPDGRADAKRR